MSRVARFVLVVFASLLAIPVLVSPAQAASQGFGGCTVQVNKPHHSGHNPGRINTEFKVSGCAKPKSVKIERKFSTSFTTPDGHIGGGGDFAWKPVDTVNPGPAPGTVSRFYNQACTKGVTYTATMQARFTIDGRSTTLTESQTFVCKG